MEHLLASCWRRLGLGQQWNPLNRSPIPDNVRLTIWEGNGKKKKKKKMLKKKETNATQKF